MRIVHADLPARWVLTDEDVVMKIAGMVDEDGDITRDCAEATMVFCETGFGVPLAIPLWCVGTRTVH